MKIKKQSYSFDLGIIDNKISSKENIIKLNNSIWILLSIILNISLETSFIWRILGVLDPILNSSIILFSLLLLNSLNNIAENDFDLLIYENEKIKKIKNLIFYYFYTQITFIVIKTIIIIKQREKIFNFFSNDLSLRYLSLIITFFFIIKLYLIYLFKNIVKDNFITLVNENS